MFFPLSVAPCSLSGMNSIMSPTSQLKALQIASRVFRVNIPPVSEFSYGRRANVGHFAEILFLDTAID